MTLILSRFSRLFVLQVTDRLVTQAGKPFDAISNKNLVYIARDGILALGYTGVAFLDGIPTDHWMAEKLTGGAIKNPRRPGTLQFGPLAKWCSVGLAEQVLASELNASFSKLTVIPIAKRLPFEIQIVGWQWGRGKRPRPFLSSIQKRENTSAFILTHSVRHLGRNFFVAVSPEANTHFIGKPSLLASLRGIKCADDAERALAKAIHEASLRTPLIGPNCMSILLPPPHLRQARIRYIGAPAFAQLISASDPARRLTFPAAFSPWVIGPGLIHAPSIISGGFTDNVGGFEVRLEAPEPPVPGIRFAMGSLPRPSDPSL